MIKIYPSSAAFKVGDLVFTQYSSGCLRAQLLQGEGLREKIDEKHTERGALHEHLLDAAYERSGGKAEERLREVPFQLPIGPTGALVSGKIDALLRGEIKEYKSTESSGVIADVIENGKVKDANVAQVLIYEFAQNKSTAELIYTGYKKVTNRKTKAKEYVKTSDRSFEVGVDPAGWVTIDGKRFKFTAHELIAWLVAAVDVREKRYVASRPYGENSFTGPCKWCAFADTCRQWDEDSLQSVEDFVDSAKQELQRKGKSR